MRTVGDLMPKGIYIRKPRRHVMVRWAEKVRLPESPDGCWEWSASRHSSGYGQFYYNGRGNGFAHRFAYERFVGPIPSGLQIDHLCRNRTCVNPSHLEPVTAKENLRRGMGFSGRNARKTHCPKGHPYDEQNTYWRPDGMGKDCLTCRREVGRRRRLKR